MKLVSAILGGFAFGTIAAITSVVWGSGVLTAIGAYIVFGMIGTVLVGLINWIAPRPFARSRQERKREAALTLSDTAMGQNRF